MKIHGSHPWDEANMEFSVISVGWFSSSVNTEDGVNTALFPRKLHPEVFRSEKFLSFLLDFREK